MPMFLWFITLRLAELYLGIPPTSSGDLGTGGMGFPAGAVTGGLY